MYKKASSELVVARRRGGADDRAEDIGSVAGQFCDVSNRWAENLAITGDFGRRIGSGLKA